MDATKNYGSGETILGDLLTSRDVAALFDRTELTVLLWRRSHNLPYVRIKGNRRDTIRYRRSDLRAWAEKNDRQMKLEPNERVQLDPVGAA